MKINMKKGLIAGALAVMMMLTACGNMSNSKDNMSKSGTMGTENCCVENMGGDAMQKDGMQKDDMQKDGMQKDGMQKDDMKKDDMKKDDMQSENMLKEIDLEDINGNKFVLKDAIGKKIYIKFWASWCPICLDGLADLDELSKNADYEVLSVVSPGNLGEKNKEDFIKWFNGLNYKNIRVLLDVDAKFAKTYGVRFMPTNFIVNSKGELVKFFPGPVAKETLEKIYKEID